MEVREIFEVKEIFGLAGVPFIIALVEWAKRSFPVLGRDSYPLLAMALGVLVNLALGWYLHVDVFVSVVVGIVAGLAASGLYSGGKEVVER